MIDLRRDTWGDLLRLGWPVSATLLVRVTMRTVDLVVVGATVGAAGVAALGIGDAVARLVLFTALGLGAGTIATVSQSVGAARPDAADRAVSQTALLAVLVGIPFSVAGWFTAGWFYEVLGAAPDVAELGAIYLRIVIATAVPRMLAIMLTRAYQGSGDTRTPLVIRSVGTGLNVAVTILLVPGLLGLPELGVTGAAVGTAAGNVFSAVVLLAVLARGRSGIRITAAGLRDLAMMHRIVRIGSPQVVERTLYGLAALPLNAIVLRFGTAANAGYHVGRRVMLYGLLPSRGVATAVSAYMGAHVGGRDPDEGERYARGGLVLAGLIGAGVAVPVLLFARPLAAVFLREPGALAVAVDWVRVYAAVMVLRALYGTLRSAMQGANDTWSPLWASALGLGGFALGFSWLVGVQLGVGLAGVFAGVVLDPVARTAVLYRWFATGRWRRYLATTLAVPAADVPPSGATAEITPTPDPISEQT